MKEHLDCAVIRDLLPLYVEALAGPETMELVREHLEDCTSCRQAEKELRAKQAADEEPGTQSIAFLRWMKRMRLLAAVLTLVLTAVAVAGVYQSEFLYIDNAGDRLQAVRDAVLQEKVDEEDGTGLTADNDIWLIEAQEQGDRQYLYFGTDHEENVRGIVVLGRGAFGRYRVIKSEYGTSLYTQGVEIYNLEENFLLAGDRCDDIASVELVYAIGLDGREVYLTQKYDITEENFVWVWDRETVEQQLQERDDFPDETWYYITIDEVRSYDTKGSDLTEQYRMEGWTPQWGGGQNLSRETNVYVWMGIVGALGLAFACFVLRK